MKAMTSPKTNECRLSTDRIVFEAAIEDKRGATGDGAENWCFFFLSSRRDHDGGGTS